MNFNLKTRGAKIGTAIATVAAAGLILGACGQGDTGPSAQTASVQNDVQSSASALQQLQQSQPTPTFKWSQLRETLIDIEEAQANSTQTTSFFFNQGVTAPVSSCPSIGFAVAADSELTNPQQIVTHNDDNDNGATSGVISQADPTGIYSGGTTGTDVVCVAPDGSTYIDYWEGFVDTVTGPAVWNSSTNSIQLTGPSTVHVKTGPAAK